MIGLFNKDDIATSIQTYFSRAVGYWFKDDPSRFQSQLTNHADTEAFNLYQQAEAVLPMAAIAKGERVKLRSLLNTWPGVWIKQGYQTVVPTNAMFLAQFASDTGYQSPIEGMFGVRTLYIQTRESVVFELPPCKVTGWLLGSNFRGSLWYEQDNEWVMVSNGAGDLIKLDTLVSNARWKLQSDGNYNNHINLALPIVEDVTLPAKELECNYLLLVASKPLDGYYPSLVLEHGKDIYITGGANFTYGHRPTMQKSDLIVKVGDGNI